jgi:hypothetical protein
MKIAAEIQPFTLYVKILSVQIQNWSYLFNSIF